MGSLSPDKPCLVHLAREKGLPSNLDLSMCVEWGESSAPRDYRAEPKKRVREQTPPCTDLISDTAEVLRTKERWPAHLCYNDFLEESTRLWAERHGFTFGSPHVANWTNMHPLPVGRRALMIRRDVSDLLAWSEVLDALPFEEYGRPSPASNAARPTFSGIITARRAPTRPRVGIAPAGASKLLWR